MMLDMKHTLLTLCLIVFALPSWGGTTISGGNISGGKISSGEDGNTESKVRDDINCKADIFSHPNVGQKYVERVELAFNKSCEYFGDATVEAPLEIWVSSRGSEQDKAELIKTFCEHRKSIDVAFNKCEKSQIGGSNAVRWGPFNGSNYKFYQLNLRKYSDELSDPSAEYVTMHEYFHIWQMHKIGALNSPDRRFFDKRVGKTGDGSRPWFSEGSATFLSHYLYSKMAKSDHLKAEMLRYLKKSKHKIKEGMKIKELKYADWKSGGEDAYNISTWAIAYLIHLVGLEQYLAIYDDLDEMEFEDAFVKNFNLSSDEFDKKFVDFMITSSSGEKIKMLPK